MPTLIGEDIPTASERGQRRGAPGILKMTTEKDMKSLQESEEQYGSCAERELIQSLDASASELTADDMAYHKIVEQCQILKDKYYKPKDYIFKVNGIPTMPIGDINLIQAQAKQGKSTLVTLLVAACLCGKLGALEYILEREITVVVFDTEQFESDSHKQLTMMHELGEGNNGTVVKMFNLRKLGFDERTEFIKQVILREKPEFVIIDGIRDLIPDINDPVGCPMLVQEMMQLASEVGCAILGVLHNNPNEGKARGWIGTEWINKCAYSFLLEKNGSVVTVKTAIYRGAPVPEWQFTYGADGKPTCDDSFVDHRLKIDREKEKREKESRDQAKLQSETEIIIAELRNMGGKMKRSEFVDCLVDAGKFKRTHLQMALRRIIESESPLIIQNDGFIFVKENSNSKDEPHKDDLIF